MELNNILCISDLQARANKVLPHPPKPRVVIQKPTVDVVGMEQTISGLRAENVELKKQINESQSVIVGLRRDLSGASARLSDITGKRISFVSLNGFLEIWKFFLVSV